MFLERLWPERTALPPVALAGALVIGCYAALTLDLQRLGWGLSVVGAAVLIAALAVTRRRPGADQVVALLGALALLLAPALRAAEWLDALCVLGAIGLGTLAVVRGRSWTGVVAGAVMPLFVCLPLPGWARRALPPLRLSPARRGLVSFGLTAVLVLVFGGLFTAADPAYASLVDGVVPNADLPTIVQRSFVLGFAAVAALVAAALSVNPPQVEALRPGPARPVARSLWVGPLAALDALFLSFLVVELAVLYGGHRHVLVTKGLSYAEYARQGFWQLLVVTVLTLVVVAAAARWAPRERSGDRVLLRALLGALALMALAIVVSALHRMSLYETAFGWTRLRVAAQAIEIGLGAVLVLVLTAGIRLRGQWLPRATVGVAAAVLLGLVVMNPDAYIANHDVARFQHTGSIDTTYLSSLSADAVPALTKLPVAVRSCTLAPIVLSLQSTHDHWYDGNLARSRARSLLAKSPSGCSSP